METTTQPRTLRQTIHETTRPLHDRLDHDPLSLTVVSDRCTHEAYISFLKRTYGFLFPIEEELRHCPEAGCSSNRSALVKADLEALGESSPAPLATMAPASPPVSIDYAFGVRYVLEGSAMGGLVIAKQVQKRLHLTPEQMLFLLPQEPKAVLHGFHRFLETMEERAGDDQRRGLTLLGARHTFERIVSWFESWK